MSFKSLTTVSALALLIALPAHAADGYATTTSTTTTAPTHETTSPVMQSVKDGLASADNTIHQAADDVRAYFFGKDTVTSNRLDPILIHRNMTAQGLIGSPIVSPNGAKAGSVKDIIVNKDGQAILVVVADGGLLGLGEKVAAFEYDKVVARKTDGTVVMTLSQNMIDRAADFSYDQRDWQTAKVIPPGSLSINALLEGDLVGPTGEKVASVENIYLRSAEVSQVIVGFNKTLGMGGDLAALDFSDLQTVKAEPNSTEVDFKLTAAQVAQFKNFRQAAAAN